MTALWITRHRDELVANSRPAYRGRFAVAACGTAWRYRNLGCRCDLCRAAEAKAQRAYKQKKLARS